MTHTLSILTSRNTTEALPVAVGYCRISKAGDSKSVSIATQRAAIGTYAASRGWRLATTLEHHGISGGKRSRFARLDVEVKEHAARYVICFSLDRLGRDAAGLLDWTASAARRGIQLHVCGRGLIDATTSSGFLGTSIEAVVSEHYRIVCGEKTKAALAHLRETGRRWTRVAPFGWAWKDGQCVLDPAEQTAVCRARELRAAGLSLRAISATLAGEGKIGRAGRALSAETLNSVLRAAPLLRLS